MLSELGRRPMIGSSDGSFGEDFEKEIGLLLREQRRQDADDRERELNLFRSGSAPPTVEGSLSAVGGLLAGPGAGGSIVGSSTIPELPGDGHGFVSEEEIRSRPEYLSYYYSNVNLNPRLPPPMVSREDWRSTQRLKGGSAVVGGIGDRRKVNRTNSGRSLFSMPPGFESRKQDTDIESEKVHSSADWGGDGLIGLPGLGLGSKQKSIAEIIQDDMGRSVSVTGPPSRPCSRNSFNELVDNIGSSEADLALLRHEDQSVDPSRCGINGQNSSSSHMSQALSYSYAAALGASLSRSTTPDSQAITRAPSPCPTPIGQGRATISEKRSLTTSNSFNGMTTGMSDSSELVAALSGMKLSSNGVIEEDNSLSGPVDHDVDNHQPYLFGSHGGQNMAPHNMFVKHSEAGYMHGRPISQAGKFPYADLAQGSDNASTIADKHIDLPNSFMKVSPISTINSSGSMVPSLQQLENVNSSPPNYRPGGYPSSIMANQLGVNNLPPLFDSAAAASGLGIHGMDTRFMGLGSSGNSKSASTDNLGRLGSQTCGSALLQSPFVDPLYLQYLRTPEYAAQLAALNDQTLDRNYMGNSYLLELQKAYVGALLSPQKSQFGAPLGGKPLNSNHHGYYGSPAFGVGMSYGGSPLGSPVISNSPVGPGSPLRHNDLSLRYPSGVRNTAGGIMGLWNLDTASNINESFASSLLEEFKSNKAKCLELAEIAGHVVEFSADQYGSRFIQQKLETATTEEKNMVYQEIMPHALALMTDVFGNYVIQKFFEHGLSSQRRELAGKLFAHVLTLSLQMYGCRVIQKAIEVVDLDQKINMVEELDGHVMRCVRDQNGNHVIQKCIECVPEGNIQFIVTTFFGHVVSLSMHPYGCRVIQRILEHCRDAQTQSKVMDEILGAVSVLAQDQYGNYVVQHVLEHGKSHERSAIIKELAGQIVQMSQQKFASNVVEKCLAFGGPSERQLLVSEMLGTTDENEPLQAMMKDQFANYVVQKVLETCDDHQRELILSRIKVHLNALKKYTYGKHIVARVEKLVAAGERRIAAQSLHPA